MLRHRDKARGGVIGSVTSLIDGNSFAIALLGDSLENHNGYATQTAGSEEHSNWSRGYLNWNRILDPRGKFVTWYDDTATGSFTGLNRGISGNNTTQMAARVTDITGITGVKVCLLGGGTNDISTDTTAGNRAARLSTYQTNKTAIINALKAANIKIILLTIPPRALGGSNSWASGSEARGLWQDMVAWDQAQADADPTNIKIVRRDLICSNADADRSPKTGYLNADNVHLAPIAGYHIAADSGGLNEALASIMSSFSSFPAAMQTGEITTNPTLSGSSGTVSTGCTGVAPTGMRFRRSTGSAITAVGSKETIGGEEYFKIVITRTGAGGSETISLDYGANISSGLPSVGDWIQAAMKAKWDASPAITLIGLQARQQPTSPANMNNYTMRIDTGYPWENAAIAAGGGEGLWQIAPPQRIREGMTSILYNALITVDNSTAGTDTVWISRMHLYTLADPRPDYGFSGYFIQAENNSYLLTENSKYLEK